MYYKKFRLGGDKNPTFGIMQLPEYVDAHVSGLVCVRVLGKVLLDKI